MSDFVVRDGERLLHVAVVAQWYQVEVAWIEEAAELELLVLESAGEGDVLLPEHQLDRLAQLLRWSWQSGLDLAALALIVPSR